MARRRKTEDNGLDSLIQVGLEALGTAIYAAIRAWWDHKEQRATGLSDVIDANTAFKTDSTTAKKKRAPRRPTPWWKTLGVSESASQAEIQRAYRDLIAKTHPDKVTHLSDKLRRSAEREAKKINEAYEQARAR